MTIAKFDGGDLVWGHEYEGHFIEGGRLSVSADGQTIAVIVPDDAYSGAIEVADFMTFARGAGLNAETVHPGDPHFPLHCGACGGRWVEDHDGQGRCDPVLRNLGDLSGE